MTRLTRREALAGACALSMGGCTRERRNRTVEDSGPTANPLPAEAIRARVLVPEVLIDDSDLLAFVGDFLSVQAQEDRRRSVEGLRYTMDLTNDQAADQGLLDSFLMSTDYFDVLRRGQKKVRYKGLYRMGEPCVG